MLIPVELEGDMRTDQCSVPSFRSRAETEYTSGDMNTFPYPIAGPLGPRIVVLFVVFNPSG